MKSNNKLFKASVLKTKKILTVFLTAIMILSVLMTLTTVSQPVSAASGSVTYDPSVYSSGISTLVVANGGSFSSGATVNFYVSASNSFGSSSSYIGTYTLPAGTTSLSNAVLHLAISQTPGTYYIAASDDNRATFTSGTQITVTNLAPSITVSSTAAAGGSATVTGKQFDPGSIVNIYLGYAGGQMVASNIAVSTGYFSTSVTIPEALSQSSSTYYMVAQEVSGSSLNYGVTASGSFTAQASISVSPTDLSPARSSTIVITGYGFNPGSTVASNSVTLSSLFGSISSISNAATIVTSSGQLSLTVTFNSSNADGPVGLTLTTSPSSSPSTFSSAFYLSLQNLTNLKFTFAVTPTTGSTYNVGNSAVATVYNFPTSQQVSVYLGLTTVGVVTTDGNGYGQIVTSIPAIPAGTYYPTAVATSLGLYQQASSSIVISSYFTVENPSGSSLSTSPSIEYIPSTALLTVSAYGLNPTLVYNVNDSQAASKGVYVDGSGSIVTSINVGKGGTNGISPASNGTLIFSYVASYATHSTGTTSTITMSHSVPGYSSNGYGYDTVGTPTISSPSLFQILTQSASANLVVNGLIPFQAPVYPGTTYYYSAYFGTSSMLLTFSNIVSQMFYANGGSFSGTYTVPSNGGVFDVNVTYFSASYSSSLYTQHAVVASLGSSYSSGTLKVIPLPTAGNYYVVGYNYYLKNPSLYVSTYTSTASIGTESLTHGTFAVEITPGVQPAGTYSVFTVVYNSGTPNFVYSSYIASANLTLVTTSGGSISSGPIGTSVYVKGSGLVSTGYYNVYFGTDLVLTDTGSGLSGATDHFTVPTVLPGNYSITVTPVGGKASAESAVFEVVSPSSITLSLTPTDATATAFPGELVNFVWAPTTTGFNQPSPTTGSSPYYTPISVTVYLNDTALTSITATYMSSTELQGSFLMPNSAPGSYYSVTFSWSQTTYTTETATATGVPSTTEVSVQTYSGTTGSYLQLVSGSGALLVSTTNETAVIQTAINSAMKVPLSELNASISTINGLSVTITTGFGTMESTLSSLDATITSISSGVATLQTTLGTVSTSLESLNSTIISLNGDTAKISTAVGVFNTTINNINATVTISSGNIATIKTDLGTFTGSVTSVSDGIATIQTALGTIQTNTNQVVPPFGTSFLLEVIILILVVLAVAFSALAMVNSKKSYYRRE